MKSKTWLIIEKLFIKWEKAPSYNYKKLSSFGVTLLFRKLKYLFYLALGFRKFAGKTKSAVILHYEIFFYSTLNQQSSKGTRFFLFYLLLAALGCKKFSSKIYFLISTLLASILEYKFFTLGQYPSQIMRTFFRGEGDKRNFFTIIFFYFLGLGLESTLGFFYRESLRTFSKREKSCDSRSNQTSFENIKNF